MYNKIMVPLDGSTIAERVLLHIEAIVKGDGAQNVVFVSVVEPKPFARIALSVVTEEQEKQIVQSHIESANKYLSEIMTKANLGNTRVQSEVLKGSIFADTLIDYADKSDVDLIVIATHGYSGLSRWAWGNTAERVLRSSHCSVLLVR